jgi:hypothetical protein
LFCRIPSGFRNLPCCKAFHWTQEGRLMNTRPDNPESREPKAGELPADVARLGAMLDARGRRQREALSSEALERIAAMSDLQLPIVGADEPVVIARIETSSPSWWATPRVWRVAAAVAVLAGVGAATFLAVRAFRSDAPAEGTLVDGSRAVAPIAPAPQSPIDPTLLNPARAGLAPAHLESALASSATSATAVVVALSGSVNEPAMHYHDLDESLAADIAPLFQSGSLLDGGGLTYDDLSSEFAAIVAPKSFR